MQTTQPFNYNYLTIQKKQKFKTNIYHGKIVKAEFVGEEGSREQVGYLKCECSSILVLLFDHIADFVVDADDKASVDVVLFDEPVHAHEHDVQEVDGRALHHPIDARCDELFI